MYWILQDGLFQFRLGGLRNRVFALQLRSIDRLLHSPHSLEVHLPSGSRHGLLGIRSCRYGLRHCRHWTIPLPRPWPIPFFLLLSYPKRGRYRVVSWGLASPRGCVEWRRRRLPPLFLAPPNADAVFFQGVIVFLCLRQRAYWLEFLSIFRWPQRCLHSPLLLWLGHLRFCWLPVVVAVGKGLPALDQFFHSEFRQPTRNLLRVLHGRHLVLIALSFLCVPALVPPVLFLASIA